MSQIPQGVTPRGLLLASTATRNPKIPLWLQRLQHHSNLPRKFARGHPTNGLSGVTEAADPLAIKERHDRPRTFSPGTAFLPGTRSIPCGNGIEVNHLP